MRRQHLLLFPLFLLLASCGGGSHGSDVEDKIAAVQSNLLPGIVAAGQTAAAMTLEDRMAHYKTPGVSIAVINDGKIEWARGFGVTEAGGSQAVDADTLFQAASISKTLDASAVMLLSQSGLINIDHEANSYLRSWKIPDNEFTAAQKVTVRQLLSHTGGISVDGFGGYQAGQPVPTLLQLLDGISPANNDPIRVEAVPGSQWSYSGGGSEILHLLVQDVTGISYRQYLQDEIFSLLNMSSSDYPETPASPAASGHDLSGSVIPGKWNIYPELGAAGLWTTASDLARFALSIQSSALGASGQPLSPQTVDAMLTAQATIDEDEQQGLGFRLDGSRFRHSGSNSGFRAELAAYSDRGQGAVIMTNGENGDALIPEILRSISKVYGWPDYKPDQRTLVAVPAQTLDTYAGRYQSDVNSTVYVIARDGENITFSYEGAGNVPYPLYAIAADTFILQLGQITFVKDAEGRVAEFQYSKSGVLQMTGVRL